MIQGRDFAGHAIVGQRSGQEDDYGFLVVPSDMAGGHAPRLVVVLADGMGGHVGGASASGAAVRSFLDHSEAGLRAGEVLLDTALAAANTQIALEIKAHPELEGMGCTLIGAEINEEGLRWVSVGDSLLLLYRDGELVQLNEDHSMAAIYRMAVDQGLMSAEEARHHPDRSALRSAVMGGRIERIDHHETLLPLGQGDIVVLASDGLETLAPTEITATLAGAAHHDAAAIARALTDAVEARQKPRQDNTTVLVIKYGGHLPSAMAAGPVGLWRQPSIIAALLVMLLLIVAAPFVYYFRAPIMPIFAALIQGGGTAPAPGEPPAGKPAPVGAVEGEAQATGQMPDDPKSGDPKSGDPTSGDPKPGVAEPPTGAKEDAGTAAPPVKKPGEAGTAASPVKKQTEAGKTTSAKAPSASNKTPNPVKPGGDSKAETGAREKGVARNGKGATGSGDDNAPPQSGAKPGAGEVTPPKDSRPQLEPKVRVGNPVAAGKDAGQRP